MRIHMDTTVAYRLLVACCSKGYTDLSAKTEQCNHRKGIDIPVDNPYIVSEPAF